MSEPTALRIEQIRARVQRLQGLAHSASRSKAKVHREIDDTAEWLLTELDAVRWAAAVKMVMECPFCAMVHAERDAARTELEAAQAENARLRETLEHYATIGTLGPETTGTKPRKGRVGVDLGTAAREALGPHKTAACPYRGMFGVRCDKCQD